MNFTNILYFVTAAEESNMSKAAKKLYISQQSLSNHISRLERELGVHLFERGSKIKLTYAGECVFKSMRDMLNIYREMRSQLDDILCEKKGRLSIGVSTRVCGQIVLPQVLPAYHAMFPFIELHLESGLTMDLVDHLRQGSLDVMLGVQAPDALDIVSYNLFHEHLCLIVPKKIFNSIFQENAPAAAKAFAESGVEFSAFRNAPFLLMEKGKRIRTFSDQVCSKIEFTPQIVLQSTDIETLLGLSFSGLGIMFAFEETIKKYMLDTCFSASDVNNPVYVFPILDQSVMGNTYLCYCNSHYMNNACKSFVNLVLDTFHLNSLQ